MGAPRTMRLAALLGLVAVAAGCSRGAAIKTVPVSGKVTYKGQPVEGATVSFIPDGDGRPAIAMSSVGGAYRLMTLDVPGAMPGSYTVTVRKSDIPLESTKPVTMEEAVKMNTRPPPAPKELLPTKYADASKSPLKLDVKPGQNNTIDLLLAD